MINTTPWFIDVIVENRTGLMTYLKSVGIGSRVMYPPLNNQKAYQIKGSFPISEMIGNKGLWLPSASQLSNESIIRITNEIRKFYEK